MICENYFYHQNENFIQNYHYNYYYQYYEDNYNYEQYYSKILLSTFISIYTVSKKSFLLSSVFSNYRRCGRDWGWPSYF